MIAGVTVEIGREAVVVVAAERLRVLSSAVHLGGFAEARAILNVHVAKDDPGADPSRTIDAFAGRAAVPGPWVGLLTGAATERAVIVTEATVGCTAMAVVTVGLSHPVAAGHTPIGRCGGSTINMIVVVDADPEPAALVNAAMTATEVKGLALRDAGILTADGAPASGTSTDAVAVAATGRGGRVRYGGPASPLGWAVARAVRGALDRGIREWKERDR
jgi:adenosylcobinamide kinase/adenosylcobinamide-phosphate guanylyltransferase